MKGIETSRRDDLESLLYACLQAPPWDEFIKPKLTHYELMNIMSKKQLLMKFVVRRYDFNLSVIFNYIKALQFEDRPDYRTLQQLLKEICVALGN
jgi:hypothetical protein